MARDYASRGPRRSQVQQRGQLPGWAWLVFGLSMGLAVAAFVYISRPAGAMREDAVVLTGKPADAVPAKTRNGRLALPPEEKERFTFYKNLKEQKVYIPRDERPPPPRPATPAAAATAPAAPAQELFLIQVASFRASAEAEKEKARLALVGVESRIEKVTVDDRETYFRVRVGPMSVERAQAALARLQENGFNGIVVKAN